MFRYCSGSRINKMLYNGSLLFPTTNKLSQFSKLEKEQDMNDFESISTEIKFYYIRTEEIEK